VTAGNSLDENNERHLMSVLNAVNEIASISAIDDAGGLVSPSRSCSTIGGLLPIVPWDRSWFYNKV
jgi:hypothetical protein